MNHILIAEDDSDIRRLLRFVLANRCNELLFAYDGDQAISLARTHLPDLIVMDIGLPRLDGLTAACRLKATPYTSQIPILALTAHIWLTDPNRCASPPFNQVLTKPFEIIELCHTIDMLLSSTRSYAIGESH